MSSKEEIESFLDSIVPAEETGLSQRDKEKLLDDAWLDIDVNEDELFNPMDFVFSDTTDNKEVVARLSYVMAQPEYFYFTCKYILNVELMPFQTVILQELWGKKFPMLIGSRGLGKSFILAVYSILRCLLMPRRKIIVVGAAFRQSKVIYEYMETIWKNAPVLRDLCDNNSGPYKDIDRCVMKINGGLVTCLPLGDGQKIRGQRAHDIINDEFSSMPREIFENVVAGFAAVSATPLENVKRIAREKKARKHNLPIEDKKYTSHMANQIVLAGTAYYEFNHFAQEWKKYKRIIETKGNKAKLQELLKVEDTGDFDYNDYTIMRIPVTTLPEGFMDSAQINRARATVHSGIFQMEYGSVFTSDSQGFFKRSLIESCTCSPTNLIRHSSGDVSFDACLRGSADKQYVFGIDPASEVDNFSIVVLEIHKDHRRLVYCWTTTRTKHKEQLKTGLIDENDFYSYCCRKIRNLMKVFPCKEIALDSQGGGVAIIEGLHDKDKIRDGELPIWPKIIPDKEQDTDDMPGLHIVEMCNFAKADWLGEANHGLRKDLEDKVMLFPYFDTVSLGLSLEQDKIENRVYDTLEDCFMEIEELKNELSMITVTLTPSGREHWDTPSTKVATGKKDKLRKDRYSALIMANMSARQVPHQVIDASYYSIGGFARPMESDENTSKDYYIGPNWFTQEMGDMY